MQGSTLHLETGREAAAFGFSKIVTACGKSFFEGDKYLRGEKKKCAKCEAAQHRLHLTAAGLESDGDGNNSGGK